MSSAADNGAPVVLVTGAAGQLGSAIVASLLERGAGVAMADLDESAQTVADAAGNTMFVGTDVTRSEQVSMLLDTVLDRFGRIDACVNNAGIEGPVSPVEELDLDEVLQVFEVNVFGLFRMLKGLVPVFKERGGGRIVNIASGAGLAGTEHMSAYSASKHAVVGLTRSVARETAAHGVVVNAVCPGCIDSPMMSRIEEAYGQVTGVPASFVGSIPMRRYAEPAEVGDLVAYLALEAPAYLTGAAMVIDGAFRA